MVFFSTFGKVKQVLLVREFDLGDILLNSTVDCIPIPLKAIGSIVCYLPGWAVAGCFLGGTGGQRAVASQLSFR